MMEVELGLGRFWLPNVVSWGSHGHCRSLLLVIVIVDYQLADFSESFAMEDRRKRSSAIPVGVCVSERERSKERTYSI